MAAWYPLDQSIGQPWLDELANAAAGMQNHARVNHVSLVDGDTLEPAYRHEAMGTHLGVRYRVVCTLCG